MPDTITGTLEGKVFDSNGAPMSGVRLRVINLETGNQRATLTNLQGQYRIAFLPLGKYRIEVLKEGFALSEPTKEPIKIQLNQTFLTIPDIVMKPALPDVTVTTPVPTPPPPTANPAPPPPPTPPTQLAGQEDAAGRLSNQFDATRRANGDEQQVALLPLSGIRSFDDLAHLSAGVAPPPQVRGVAGPGIGPGIGTAGQFSVNGQRARSNNFTVDGSDNNDEDVGVRRQGFVALVPQSIESVKEVQIVTHLWDAEFGRSAGSQVNAVSKSGGNQVHGSVYDFFNHSALNARNFFDYTSDRAQSYQLNATAFDRFVNGSPVNPRTVPVVVRTSNLAPVVPFVQPNPSLGKDPSQRNQGGGVIGFPIVRDQTFFFASFERQDIKARQETHFAVPTVAQRGFLNSGASGFPVIDANGQRRDFIPTSTAGDSVFSLFPFPNNPIGPYGDNTFTQVLPADGEGTIFSGKLDHSFRLFGPEITHNFTARYNFTNDNRQVPVVGEAIFSGVQPRVGTQNLSLFLTSQISPTLANQLRVSYGRTRLQFSELRDPYLTPSRFLPNEPFLLNSRQLINLNSPAFPQSFVNYRLTPERFDTEGNLGPIGQVVVTPFSPVGLDVYLFPQARANNTIQFADTVSYFSASHTLKFGADLRRSQLNSFLNRNFRPQVVFGGSVDLSGTIAGAPVPNLSQLGPTPGLFSGTDLAALGISSSFFQSLAIGQPDSTIGLRFWQFNFFVNDTWRARRGLSLDYGLRYEYNSVPHEVDDRIERTFAFDRLPAHDSSVTLGVFTTNGALVYDSATLLNLFNGTVNAVRGVIGNRRQIFDPDRNNFGGQLGFAWDPLASNAKEAGKTVIRGGAGVYYDLTLGSVVSQSRNVFPNFVPVNFDANVQNILRAPEGGLSALANTRFFVFDIINQGRLTSRGLLQPGQLNQIQAPAGAIPQLLGLLFNPFNPLSPRMTVSGGGIAFTLPDRKLRSPYTLQYNLQVERELFNEVLVNLAYVGSHGVKLTRFRTPNGGPNSVTSPVDPLGFSSNPILALAVPPLSRSLANPGRPNRNLGAFTIFDSSATAIYHSLQASVAKRFSNGYQFSAAYTWSHAIDNVSDVFDLGGAFALPQDDRRLDLERGSANFDLRHRFAVSAVGNLPLLRRYNATEGVKGRLLGDWQFALISSLQTGQPFTVNTSFDLNLDGNLTDRLDTSNGLQVVDDRQQRLAVTTNAVNLLAALGTNGRVGRNAFRASGVARTDLTLIKSFRVTEGQTIVLRAEAFNIFNRTHFAIPVRILEAPGFGRSADTYLSPRQIQFALKYVF
ncbi:MAG TPA: carboxypeptidase-like regulatory domain-containing protein [Blastocatellia bacterium]|nr:carboxypeptidase-like regulatory domain-containing protein [Blastocatellia bacterium]